jgi:hypothetical protein
MNLGQYFQTGHWLDKYGWTNIKETHKDILSNNKERHKDCPMNMNTRHFSSWTNTRQMDKNQFFPFYFFNRTWDNVFYVADTLSNMHGTHKNSPYRIDKHSEIRK